MTVRPARTSASARAASNGTLKFVLISVEMPRAVASPIITGSSSWSSGSPQLQSSSSNSVSPSSRSNWR